MSYHDPAGARFAPLSQNGTAWPSGASIPLAEQGLALGKPSPPPSWRARGIPGLTLLDGAAQSPTAPTEPADTTAKTMTAPPVKQGKKRKNKKQAAALKAETPRSPSYSPKLSPKPLSAPNDSQEARQVPSIESGGVPEPSPLYLARSFAPPVTLAKPWRILVILDLNGTVLYRPTRRQPTTFVERPHARRFLAYCLDAFSLAIWSSARPDNVRNMLNQLLTRDQRAQCVVAWARDRMGLSPADYNSRVQCYKRLTAVWNDAQVQASHPDAPWGGRWDQSNTVLVDDSPEKGRSEPHNILAVPEFSGLQNEMVDVLPQVHDYLNSLCHQEDISRFMRQHPFKLDLNYRLAMPTSQELRGRGASA
ncbi:hypothetical protein HIM_05040 [Hirsutella minnesotensis 3608]|uniref:Mitochondrial import inner membrane translocase subunit TIM50 n=1 Tax=Hirsutella minnesotensis 3608 TaxID=1043627 RepID=A0A0F8A0S4_9HYPO|nr:hypothetical protein HIM_05040 [Hirsutella minnesotensis 3608]